MPEKRFYVPVFNRESPDKSWQNLGGKTSFDLSLTWDLRFVAKTAWRNSQLSFINVKLVKVVINLSFCLILFSLFAKNEQQKVCKSPLRQKAYKMLAPKFGFVVSLAFTS